MQKKVKYSEFKEMSRPIQEIRKSSGIIVFCDAADDDFY